LVGGRDVEFPLLRGRGKKVWINDGKPLRSAVETFKWSQLAKNQGYKKFKGKRIGDFWLAGRENIYGDWLL